MKRGNTKRAEEIEESLSSLEEGIRKINGCANQTDKERRINVILLMSDGERCSISIADEGESTKILASLLLNKIIRVDNLLEELAKL